MESAIQFMPVYVNYVIADLVNFVLLSTQTAEINHSLKIGENTIIWWKLSSNAGYVSYLEYKRKIGK